MEIPAEIKALLPPAIGVVAGHLMRWSRAARDGHDWLRMALFDLPAMGGLTLVAGAISRHLAADELVSAGIGTAAGYVGSEVIKTLLVRFFPSQSGKESR